MKILEIPQNERPRERMIRCGARALSNAELLAIILRTGTGRMNAIDMAAMLLQRTQGRLSSLAQLGVDGMQKIEGIGPGKALQIGAALELARRLAEEDAAENHQIIKSPADAYHNLIPLFERGHNEECWCLFLKSTRKVIGSMKISSGGESMTFINSKDIVHRALDLGAKAVILAHNHPSGNTAPSIEDIKATEQLKNALDTFEIVLMDHIILGSDSYFSFMNNEEIPKSGKKCKKM